MDEFVKIFEILKNVDFAVSSILLFLIWELRSVKTTIKDCILVKLEEHNSKLIEHDKTIINLKDNIENIDTKITNRILLHKQDCTK